MVLTQAGSSIESYSNADSTKKESLTVFFLVLQVCHLLMAGQVSSSVTGGQRLCMRHKLIERSLRQRKKEREWKEVLLFLFWGNWLANFYTQTGLFKVQEKKKKKSFGH